MGLKKNQADRVYGKIINNARSWGTKSRSDFSSQLICENPPVIFAFICLDRRLWQLKYLYFHQFVEISSNFSKTYG